MMFQMNLRNNFFDFLAGWLDESGKEDEEELDSGGADNERLYVTSW